MKTRKNIIPIEFYYPLTIYCRQITTASPGCRYLFVRKIPTTKSDFFRYRIHTMFYYNKLNKQERLHTGSMKKGVFLYVEFIVAVLQNRSGYRADRRFGSRQAEVQQRPLARIRLHHHWLCLLLHHPPELFGHQKAAPGVGHRHADGNRYYRFYLLRHVRLREIYQQLPRRPNEQQAFLLLRSFHFISYDGRHGPGKLLRPLSRIMGPQRLVPVLRRRPVHRRPEPVVQQQAARHLVRRMVYEP